MNASAELDCWEEVYSVCVCVCVTEGQNGGADSQ